MDVVNILRGLEDGVYELCVLAILIPRTFVALVFNPKWAYDSVVTEFEKPVSARFQEYASPVLFWVLVGVVPYAIGLKHLGLSATDNLWKKFFGYSLELQVLAIAVMVIDIR